MFSFHRYPLLRPRLGALLLTLLTLTGAFAQNFALKTGTDNPFNDLIAGLGTGINAGPALADFDNDGDLDLVAGHFNNRLRYFKNTGTATAAVYTELTGTDSPFNGVNPDDGYPYPAAGDLNGDGKIDLVVGTTDATFLYLKNTGTATAPAFTIQPSGSNPFEGIDVGTTGHPALADMDGDGLLDFFGSDANQTSNQYYKNTGTTSAPAFTLKTGTDNPFNNLTGIRQAVLGDLNGDGDVDLLAVGFNALLVVPNLGTPTVASLTANGSFFIVQNFGASLRGTLGDVNGDGRLDIVLGHFTGGFYYFEQVPPPTTITQQPTPARQTVCQGGSASSTVTATGENPGGAPLAYQWYRNQPDEDEPVNGQNTATLSLTNLQPAASGNYYCRVSGEGGVKWSQAFVLTVNPQGFSQAPQVDGAPLCAGLAVTVGVAGSCLGTLTAQLSDASGSFANPVSLGGVAVGSQSVVIPPNTPFGTGYRIRIVSANPDLTSESSEAFTVNTTAFAATPTVSGAPLCAGQALTVAFSGTCLGTLTAQLSDASGSFANPVSLGAVVVGSNPVVIPPSTPFGTGYRIRIVSTNPALTSPASEPFRVNTLGQVAVALYPATPGRICLDEALPVTFSTTGPCPFPVENVFTVQLSNASGSFANPIVLGTAQPGTTTFAASLLTGLPVGTGYRVRILSSLPATTSQPSAPFELRHPSLSGLTPGVGGVPVCRGQAVTVSFTLLAGSCPFPEGNAFTAQLSSASGSFASPVSLGPISPGVANSVTIPANVAAGTGYRIRLVSSSPALTSGASIPFRVNACTSRLSAEEADLVVSPNPVVGREIRLRVSGMDDPQFALTAFSGLSLSVSVKTDGSGEFVLTPKQTLTPGLYAVQASEGPTRLTRRVLVGE